MILTNKTMMLQKFHYKFILHNENKILMELINSVSSNYNNLHYICNMKRTMKRTLKLEYLNI